MNPLVSIVIPCYKGERYLAEAIESCLKQTYQNLEIIVVDDASPDRCAEIAEGYALRDGRLRVIRHSTNGGASRAFNTGFEAARGEFMTRLAQDDYFAVDALEIMSNYLQQHAEAGLVYCDFHHLITNVDGTTRLRYYTTPEPEKGLDHGNALGVCLMWRRTVWRDAGGFDPHFDTAEDFEFLRRVSAKYRLEKIPGVSPFFVRLHPLMGSIVYSGKQEVAAARVKSKHADSWWQSRQHLSAGYCNAAFNYRQEARFDQAWTHCLRAIAFWPFSWKPWRLMVQLGRQRWSKPWPKR
jgi:glycosyltransferase involved in cell wall biosynthesis